MFGEKTFALPFTLLGKIVEDLEKKTGYIFSSAEILQILDYTGRKLSIIEKDADYFPILFESELCDYLMRESISA